MPTNKEALIRYRVINRCLKDFKYATKEKLIRACEEALDISPISTRTIYQDIRDMKKDPRLGYFAPIEKDKNRDAYYYADEDYSIDNIQLSDEDVKALTFTATMLDQYRNISIFSTFTGAVQKIVDAINVRRLTFEDDFYPFIEFEQAPYVLGHEHIEPIIMAIRQKQVIKFDYQRFNHSEVKTYRVHPYLLKQFKNRWYLIGMLAGPDKIFTFCLDRFQSSPFQSRLPFRATTINFREYYRNVIGVNMPTEEDPVEVVLKFSKDQAWYVITQPIHTSQRVIENDDHFIVELNVIPTYELTMLIMGWGPEVEVIEPKSLRQEILELHKRSIEKIHNI